VALDVTAEHQGQRAAANCSDIDLLINNAGAMLATPILGKGAEAALRREMDVNVFGVLAMAHAFAPVLAGNGGGVLVNMLSVVSWYVYPFNATYCVSKHAALAVTNALAGRAEGARHRGDRRLCRVHRHRHGGTGHR
jgi:NAD(P)-dependent dehydrogenase (short-subunit alcohol dehydrogenase family)